jgi:hypothetical protein
MIRDGIHIQESKYAFGLLLHLQVGLTEYWHISDNLLTLRNSHFGVSRIGLLNS